MIACELETVSFKTPKPPRVRIRKIRRDVARNVSGATVCGGNDSVGTVWDYTIRIGNILVGNEDVAMQRLYDGGH